MLPPHDVHRQVGDDATRHQDDAKPEGADVAEGETAEPAVP